MLASAALLSIAWLAQAASGAAPPDKLYAQIERRLGQLAVADNSSDDKLLLRDLRSFVSDNGLRRQRGRTPPDPWSLASISKWIYKWMWMQREQALCDRAVDMMRQAMYTTQNHINDLAPVMERRNREHAFRITFISLRLRQLIVDMRRIYTFAVRWRQLWGTYEQVRWYTHALRKYVDVLYIVEHVISMHQTFTKPLLAEIGSVLGKNG